MSNEDANAPGSVLTRDNIHLSRPKNDNGTGASIFAIDCKSTIEGYVRASVSENSQRAYQSDLRHFTRWGGTIPSSPEMVSAYLAAHAVELTVATLKRRIASIAVAHAAASLPSPTTSKLVRATLKGIQRTHGSAQRQARPLLVEDLVRIMAVLGETPKDIRDRALLLMGFAGAFRRSELVAIDCNDIEQNVKGIIVAVARSKTDQEGCGRGVAIPYARGLHCPVVSLNAWLQLTNTTTGPVFRPISRHGNVLPKRLSGEAVALIVKQRISDVGGNADEYSGHSLRSGLATSAAAAGVSSWKIRAQTGHASDMMLSRYIRDGEMFTNNAASVLL